MSNFAKSDCLLLVALTTPDISHASRSALIGTFFQLKSSITTARMQSLFALEFFFTNRTARVRASAIRSDVCLTCLTAASFIYKDWSCAAVICWRTSLI